MSDAPRLRLFVAVDVPVDVLELVERVTKPLQSSIEGARWTARTGRHITVKFLGYTDAGLLDELKRALAGCSGHAPAPIRLAGLGAFPSPKRARVVWAGIEDPEGLLAGLAAEVSSALEPLGFEPEKRSFSPHLTLARLRAPGSVEAALAAAPTLASRPFDVGSFALYRSLLHPQGARYQRLCEFRLDGPF